MPYPDDDDDEKLLLFDGHADALIGVTDSWSGPERPRRAVYDGPAIIAKLVGDGMSEEDAEEFLEFKIAGAYVGPQTPVIVWPLDPDEILNV